MYDFIYYEVTFKIYYILLKIHLWMLDFCVCVCVCVYQNTSLNYSSNNIVVMIVLKDIHKQNCLRK